MPSVFQSKRSPGDMNCCYSFNGDWELTKGVSGDLLCLRYFIMVVLTSLKWQ